jgi:hypothetical protein
LAKDVGTDKKKKSKKADEEQKISLVEAEQAIVSQKVSHIELSFAQII